jgi:hypothetical protein
MVLARETGRDATGAWAREKSEDEDMIKTISFGDGAGHLVRRLLEHAGVGEVEVMTVEVRPEAYDAVMELLREAAAGRWFVRVLDKPGPAEGPGDEIQLTRVDGHWLRGDEIDANGVLTGASVSWEWSQIGQLHIY